MELALQFARTDIERLTQERNSLRQRLFSAQDQIVELRTQNVLLNEQNHLLGVEVEKLKVKSRFYSKSKSLSFILEKFYYLNNCLR